MRVKKVVENVLRNYPSLFRLGSNLYHKLNGSFRTLSPGAPDAIFRALELARETDGTTPGDYYEFGVFRGYTFLAAQKASATLGLGDMNFYGFDSFKGLPPIEGIDNTNNQFFQGQFACSKDEVISNLESHGADLSRMVLIEGFYSESLTEDLKQHHPFQRAAVAFIDCDLYHATHDVLLWLTPFLTENSILVFDDWFSYGDSSDLGQPKAFHELLAANPHFRAEQLFTFKHNGNAFLLRHV